MQIYTHSHKHIYNYKCVYKQMFEYITCAYNTQQQRPHYVINCMLQTEILDAILMQLQTKIQKHIEDGNTHCPTTTFPETTFYL